MKQIIAALIVSAAVTPAFAVKPCEELKTEIAAKIDAKGVKDYQVEIVAADAVKDQTVVGTCEGGKKKITYKKGSAEKAPADKATPAQK